jgi:hypothetical protein
MTQAPTAFSAMRLSAATVSDEQLRVYNTSRLGALSPKPLLHQANRLQPSFELQKKFVTMKINLSSFSQFTKFTTPFRLVKSLLFKNKFLIGSLSQHQRNTF